MKLSLLVLAVLAAAASSAPAHEARRYILNHNVKRASKQMSPSRDQSFGAAYFITNEPSGNFIVAADISRDGKLTLRRAIETDGLGSHGTTKSAGPDPLFSQGSVKASAAGVLATVNAGSNTISTFSISPNDPTTLKQVGKPVGSGGEFPMSLAINEAGDSLCVLNGGSVNGVSCFKIDQTKGLSSIPNTTRSLKLNQTTPATGPAGTASHIIFSEDGRQLVVAVKGTPPQPGFLAVWDISTQDGSLSQDFKSIAPQPGGLLPFSLTVIPGKNAVLATDAGLGFDIFADLSGDKQDTQSNNTRSSSAVAIPGQKATCWSAFSPKTGNFYLTDIGTSLVTEINVNDNLNGTIVKQYPTANNSGTIDLDIGSIQGNDFLYVLAANATAVDVFSLDAPGQAHHMQRLDISGPAKSVGLVINPDNLQGMTIFVKKI
ncbi:hypothetical protein AX17_002314 [Amanita inopinata Kibby_2008]|nr:hypothetical protein AX17_002314 [Amanita inopinata Kibby_2008]